MGQIDDLIAACGNKMSTLRIELNRLMIMITIVGVSVTVVFVLLAILLGRYSALESINLVISLLIAIVPESLMGCITFCLDTTATTLRKKQVLVRNLDAIETLGSTSCICCDKTGTLTPLAIQRSKSAGIKVVMVTGDHPSVAATIAKKIGIITHKTNQELEQDGYSPK